MAMLGAGRLEDADRLIGTMQAAASGTGANRDMTREVGLPLAHGLMFFHHGAIRGGRRRPPGGPADRPPVRRQPCAARRDRSDADRGRPSRPSARARPLARQRAPAAPPRQPAGAALPRRHGGAGRDGRAALKPGPEGCRPHRNASARRRESLIRLGRTGSGRRRGRSSRESRRSERVKNRILTDPRDVLDAGCRASTMKT